MTPSTTGGQRNAVCDSCFHTSTKPLPSQTRILIRSARFERNTMTVAENGSSPSTSAATAAGPCAPLRKSPGRAAKSTRTPRDRNHAADFRSARNTSANNLKSVPFATRMIAPASRISRLGGRPSLAACSVLALLLQAATTAGASVTIGRKFASAASQPPFSGSAELPLALLAANPRPVADKPANGARPPSPSCPVAASRRQSGPSLQATNAAAAPVPSAPQSDGRNPSRRR